MSVEDYSKQSFRNREAAQAAQSCGCYFCLNTFKTSEIAEWVDDGLTALCPHCDLDSVLPGVVNPDLLRAGLERWFTGRPPG